ncbi:MAG: GNAT family N-acetyltransferase [Proteobacteria bacterium]|nr:GNAT family N-acetyltransferase [Pseudomonadota bacterium]
MAEIIPVFNTYLAYMSQFYSIHDYDSWCEGALKHLNRYFMDDDHAVYVVREKDEIIGFSLINKHLRFNKHGYAVAEFYIQKDHERKGYGRMLAEYVFDTYPGPWEVTVAMKNNSARMFWKQVVSLYTHDHFLEKQTPSFDGYGILFNNAGHM